MSWSQQPVTIICEQTQTGSEQVALHCMVWMFEFKLGLTSHRVSDKGHLEWYKQNFCSVFRDIS